MSEVTLILQAIGRGESRASEELMPLVYDELRRLAAARMAQESAGHTLQPTALVFVGDMVETAMNSALTLYLGKATIVKLGALAKFRIDSFVVDAGDPVTFML